MNPENMNPETMNPETMNPETLNPEILGRPQAHILGIVRRIRPQNADYCDIWTNGFEPRRVEIAARAVDRNFYGAYFATDEEGIVDFVAGMFASGTEAAPEGLTLREIPDGRYAAFHCTMQTISQTWRAIYTNWLPGSSYSEDVARPCYEEFAADAQGPDAPVVIYVPVIAT